MIAVRGACIPVRSELMQGGVAPLGTAGDDYAPCTDDGQSCADDIFAVSLPSVTPSAFVTWFQAQEASTVSALRAIAGK